MARLPNINLVLLLWKRGKLFDDQVCDEIFNRIEDRQTAQLLILAFRKANRYPVDAVFEQNTVRQDGGTFVWEDEEHVRYGGFRDEDGDGDGLTALMEFSLGLDPFLDLGFNGPSSLPRIAIGDGGQNVISFDLPVNSTAADGYGSDDIVYTVEGSDDLEEWVTLLSKSDST